MWGSSTRFRLQIRMIPRCEQSFGTSQGRDQIGLNRRAHVARSGVHGRFGGDQLCWSLHGHSRRGRGGCPAAGVHYLDVSAEQQSAQDTFERFGDAAREAGVVVVPAMGFYGGLADLVATAAADGWASVDEVRIAVALDSWHPTLGTRITGYRNTARRLMVADARLVPIPQPAPETNWEFPEPFGSQEIIELSFSEVVLIARHLRTSRLHSYINHGPLLDLRDPSTPPPRAADESGRSPQTFLIEAQVPQGQRNPAGARPWARHLRRHGAARMRSPRTHPRRTSSRGRSVRARRDLRRQDVSARSLAAASHPRVGGVGAEKHASVTREQTTDFSHERGS